MAVAMAAAGKGSANLWKALEGTFIRHRKAINALGYSGHIANAYISNGYASQLLIAAMEDPSIEVVEKQFPKMGERKKEIHNQPELKKIAH
jgi:hypothetical protein